MIYTRKHPRRPVRLRVHCTGEGIYFSDTTTNISEGGVGLQMVSAMKPGERLKLDFAADDGQRVVVEAQVVWVAQGDQENSYNTGLKFGDLSSDQLEGISYHLEAQASAGPQS